MPSEQTQRDLVLEEGIEEQEDHLSFPNFE